ncbi:MAG: RNA-directed polymerase from mobile element jockey-like [Chthonomonadaceae bacterium]|nr:RNA-directed polymerase from mobile element jockey-like [Chthonomonadaceae bacterium]
MLHLVILRLSPPLIPMTSSNISVTFNSNHTHLPANTIVCWNANSLASKLDAIKLLLSPTTINKPAVLVIVESKHVPASQPSITMHGYNQYHQPYTTQSGGISVFVHSSVSAREIDHTYPHPIISTANDPLSTIAVDDADSSSVYWLELSFPLMDAPILLAATYLRPVVSTTSIKRLRSNLDLVLSNTTQPVLIMGDLNLIHSDWNHRSVDAPTQSAVILSNYIHDNALLVLNDKAPTHFARLHPDPDPVSPASASLSPLSSGSTIDLALCSIDAVDTLTFTRDDGYNLVGTGTGHRPITVSLVPPLHPPQQPTDHQAKTCWRIPKPVPQEQWDLFRSVLTDTLTGCFPLQQLTQRVAHPSHPRSATVHHQSYIDECTATLTECVHTAAQQVFGTKLMNQRANYWFNREDVKQSYQQLHAAHQQWQLSNTDTTLQLFRQQRMAWQQLKAEAKATSWSSFVSDLQRDPSHAIRYSVFRSSKKPKQSASLSSFADPVTGELPSSHRQSLNNLANAYVLSSVPSTPLPPHMQQQADDCIQSDPTSRADDSNDWTFSADEIEEQCQYQHTATSSGADSIEAVFLKHGGDYLYSCLSALFNYSWLNSITPQSWRDANVCSIYKGAGPKHSSASFRPISVTSTVIRTFEHLLHHRMVIRLEQQQYFHSTQFGFRHNRSTVDAIHALQSNIKNYLRQRHIKFVPVLFLDLRKAFDRVNISVLLSILSNHANINGKLWGWLHSFLTHRRIRTVELAVASDWYSITYGVPQGSVLSPLLFIIFINQLTVQLQSATTYIHPVSNRLSTIHLSMFADDVAVCPNLELYRVVSGRASTVALNQHWWVAFQLALDTIGAWANQCQMEFNYGKTNIVYFTGSRSNNNINNNSQQLHQRFLFHINGTTIDVASEYCYLGVWHDSRLDWSYHFSKMIARARSDSYLIARLIQQDDQPPHFAAIHALCLTYMRARCTYALPLWQPTDKQLQQLQFCFLRPIMKLLHLPFSCNHLGLLVDMGCPSFHRYRQCMVMRLALRTAFPTVPLDPPNPSLLAMGRDSQQYTNHIQQQQPNPMNQRKPFSNRTLMPLIVESNMIMNEWGVLGDAVNYNNNRVAVIAKLKQCMLALTHSDWLAVPHRNTNDPSPLRTVVTQPLAKPYHLLLETKPTTCIRARLRHNRAYTQSIIALYTHNHSPGSNNCTQCDEPETVEHILSHCPRYSVDRDRLSYHLHALAPSQPCTMQTILGLMSSPLSPSLSATDRNAHWTRFLSLSSTFLVAIQRIRDTLSLSTL